MVVSLLQLDGAPAADAADALAAAICHGHRRRLQSRLSNDNVMVNLR
jgi:crossover junction endodeoxyribonuclease RuvC